MKAVTAGDLVSIGNYAMMLYCRDARAGSAAIKLAWAIDAGDFATDAIESAVESLRDAYLEFAPKEQNA